MGSRRALYHPCGFRRSAVRARRVGPCAPVAEVVPVSGVLAYACWNGTPCCPGVVTTLLMNAATSGVVRSSNNSVCAGPAWGNTGARLAMKVTECCRGTPRERPWAGSRDVNYLRELNNSITSSSENSWVRPFEGLGSAFRGRAGTERQAELRNSSLSTNFGNTLSATFPRVRMPIPDGSWKAIDRGRISRFILATASCNNAFRLKRFSGLVKTALITRSNSL